MTTANKTRCAFIAIFLCACFHAAFSQEINPDNRIVCGITTENSKEIISQVRTNIIQLEKAGKIVFRDEDLQQVKATRLRAGAAVSSIRFAWPMRAKNMEPYEYLMSKNFVDVDTSCEFHDYMGGEHSYDQHNGMDVGIGPYSWKRKKEGSVYAIAAAPGIIVGKRDSGYDGNCSINNPPWKGAGASGNYIAVLHADRTTVSYYKHLRNGSLTNKDSGDYVATGEYLGIVASSGRSTGPHLHFEVHIGYGEDTSFPSGILVEPFTGPNNPGTSLWLNQRPYEEPGIMGIETHNAVPDWYAGDCDSTITLTSLKNSFAPGSRVYFKTFYRDWMDNSQITRYIYKPNGTYDTIGTPANNGYSSYYNCNRYVTSDYRFSFGYVTRVFPSTAAQGTYAFRFSFYGKTYSKYFSIGCTNDFTFSGTHSGLQGYIAGNSISSTTTIAASSGNDVEYKADNFVVLKPGFAVGAGATFTANTQGCNGSY